MSTYTLTTPREADALIARIFATGQTCTISAYEDKAFVADGWLSLGSVQLDKFSESREQLLAAVRRGAFEWTVPSVPVVGAQLATLLEIDGMAAKDKDKAEGKMNRALDAIACIGVRSGLLNPQFDPFSLESMPFRRSTTVVADTSGIVQGGLDFVARFLHPAARVKIPAIVQMEVVNFATRFLATRRQAKVRRRDILLEHLMSQGGQRVLLRLELQADTELERNLILGDPLRSAFGPESDSELSDLNLSVPITAYADRLILEAARQHLAHSNLGHKVQLLTSDQGLARMALAEGITPLFFKSVVATDFFGRNLTGTRFHPFTGQLQEISISSVLWEIATAIGSVRLTSSDGLSYLTVSAFGEGLSWSPYQSHADLLWCDSSKVPDWPASKEKITSLPEANLDIVPPEFPPAAPLKAKGKPKANPALKLPQKSSGRAAAASLFKFSVAKFVALIDALDNEQTLSTDEVAQLVGAKSKGGTDEYRRFMASANLVEINDGNWKPVGESRDLAVALRIPDIDQVKRILLDAPSFAAFVESLSELPIGQVWTNEKFTRAESTYRSLGEITTVCAPIHDEGLYATPSNPSVDEFAVIAVKRFAELDHGEGLISTGAWLEELIRKDGLHPEKSRLLLQEAAVRNLLRRSTEGSTTDIRFDRHVIQALRVRRGKPSVEAFHLYRGDFLIPDKSSTSLRVEGIAQ